MTAPCQVYLVTGGYTKLELHLGRTLASTELMVEDSRGQATLWTEAGPLPSPRQALRGVSLNNNIFMTGSVWIMFIYLFRQINFLSGGIDFDTYHRSVLLFDAASQGWVEVGEMGVSRAWHGAGLVTRGELEQSCL